MSSSMAGATREKLEVKNRTPAPIQISAEQLLREAIERQVEEVRPPAQRKASADELQEYRVRKRKDFEDSVQRQRHHIGNWIKYAQWEAEQMDFRRARSIFERAINIDYQNPSLWQKYIEMECKNKFINSARNLYDRVCQLLPRHDPFWFKYAHMEEMLGNYAGARNIYDRWMDWTPAERAWLMYAKFEERCGEIEKCRLVYLRYLTQLPSGQAFIRYAKLEERLRDIGRARASFEKAIELIEDELDEDFYIKFALFEYRNHENHRAVAILEQAMKTFPDKKQDKLNRAYITMKKQEGNREAIEVAILKKRRLDYEKKLSDNPFRYDYWFDLINLEEMGNDLTSIRAVYERSIACVPIIQEKKYWKRYIYLWIYYSLFEELQTEDYERVRQIYEKCLSVIPHTKFSFSKIWQLYAEFELRRLELGNARKIYGRAIGLSGNEKIFTAYAGMELRLGNIDRCRKIYSRAIEIKPDHAKSWLAMADLELMVDEINRAKLIYEIAIDMEQLDQPELVWKSFIDFEANQGNYENTKGLYERLLERTEHYKVYKAYAEFEFKQNNNVENARKIIARGVETCKLHELPEDRANLVEHLLKIERENNDPEMIQKAIAMQPKKVRRRRKVLNEDGDEAGWEEYATYVFADDDRMTENLKILEIAKQWKNKTTDA